MDERSNHCHEFGDDIFQATNKADGETGSYTSHPQTESNNPFGNWDQNIISFSSGSSASSDSCINQNQVDHNDDHQDSMPLMEGVADHDASSSKASEPVAEMVDDLELVDTFNPRQIPPLPIQVMDKSENYDPSRIPASVFTPKSSSPMDWSAASNESLFSIHVGNTSFNKDHYLMMGADLYKADDTYKSGDLHRPVGDSLYKSGELFSLSPSPLITTPIMKESRDHDSDAGTPKLGNSATNRNMDVKVEARHEENYHQPLSHNVPTRLSTISNQSDGSGISGASDCSFAFPILLEAKRDSTEKEEHVNHPQKQTSKTSLRKSISEQLSIKVPSCSICCCSCSCFCFSWRPQCCCWCCSGS